MYPPKGYRSFGPIRGLLYGGADYAEHANDEILKLAMIETKEALNNLDEIMSTPNLDGIYIGPADLSLAIGAKPGFDNPEGSPTYAEMENILKHAKKNNIFAGMHNATPEYAEKMIKIGFQFVTVGSDLKFMATSANKAVNYLKKSTVLNKINPSNSY
jgi:4-hydroxy-2-oxoheptanedioate aldolase